MYISPINSYVSNNRASNKIIFGSAKDLNATKEMMVNFISEPKTIEILESGNMVQIGKKLLTLKNSLTNKILDLNPGSRLDAITKKETLIYDKNGKYIGAISQIPSGENPIHIGYFDSDMKEFVQVESIPCNILGNSHPRYANWSGK